MYDAITPVLWHIPPLVPERHSDRDLSVLSKMLEAGDVLAALGVLNRRVPYRFTAIHRFHAGVQQTAVLYDRLGAGQLPFSSLEMKDTFCQYITPTRPFGVTNSALDCRLQGHRYRNVIVSYYGTALSCTGMKVHSSLCHFDFEPRATPLPEDCEFLDQAKPLFSRVHH